LVTSVVSDISAVVPIGYILRNVSSNRDIRNYSNPPISYQALVISIKKFLLSSETDQTLMHVVRILIQGIGACAVGGEAEDCARFRDSVQEVSNALAGEVPPAELLVHAGSVLQALEDHTRRAMRHQHLQNLELQNMVKMLTTTVGVVSSVSNANVVRLSEIEKQVAVASQLDDVRIIKTKLADCLADIRTEADRQRKETEQIIEQLSQRVDQARQPATDPVTGLAFRAQAEAVFARSDPGRQTYVAVMVLDRLPILNARFGREEGNKILAEYARTILGRLSPGDELFRWDGPALVALLPRQKSLLHVRIEFAHMIGIKLEHTIQLPSRSILLPIEARWSIFPMMAAPRLLYQKIDGFAAGANLHD
jgi:GGDEF domain-containing protein